MTKKGALTATPATLRVSMKQGMVTTVRDISPAAEALRFRARALEMKAAADAAQDVKDRSVFASLAADFGSAYLMAQACAGVTAELNKLRAKKGVVIEDLRLEPGQPMGTRSGGSPPPINHIVVDPEHEPQHEPIRVRRLSP